MKKVGSVLIEKTIYAIGRIPRCFLQVAAYPLAHILYHWVRYRRQVVATNLKRAFPKLSEQERKKIERRYYLHLTDLILWSVKLPFLSRRKVLQHFSFAQTEVIESLRAAGHHTIVLTMGHVGNWEVFTAAPYLIKKKGFDNVNIYKQLSNPLFDQLMINLRLRHGSVCWEMKQVARAIIGRSKESSGETAIVSFLADQCPFPQAAHYATLFLGQPTTFITGWEALARKMHLPVVYMDIVSDKRFHWTGHLQLLTTDAAKEAPMALVERYAQALEANIVRQPYAWLWSHNRWRVQPHDAPRIIYSERLRTNEGNN